MKKFKILVITLSILNLITHQIFAQTPSVLLQKETSGNVTLKIGLAAAGSIQVDWGDGNLVTAEAGTTEATKDIAGTVLGSNTIKLYGVITTVYVTDASLIAVDVSNATALRKLIVPRNKIKSVDLTYNSQLYYISLHTNQFDACALDDLYRSLPIVGSGSTLVIYSNSGALTSTTAIAVNKGWTIGSGTVGDGTGCVTMTELAVYAVNDEETDAKNEDPQFRNPDGGDFTLRDISPAIDAGKNALLPTSITKDLNNNQRIINTNIDLGCFEFDSSTSNQSIAYRGIMDIFPNPVSDVLNIRVYKDVRILELRDLTGKCVLRADNITGGINVTMDVSRLAKGIYLLHTENATRKVIIQ
jgi:hypothetical protein